MRRPAVLAAALLTLLAATACGATQDAPSAEQTAMRFATAASGGDAQTACGLLTRSAVEHLEESGKTCPQAVDEAGLDRPGRPTGVEVWGSSALVGLAGGDVYLTRVDDVWRVIAAGCTPHKASPADCDLEAG
jgi:hypothetical protein